MSKYLQICPFCGNKNPVMEDVERHRESTGTVRITYEVSCPKCGAMGPYDRFQSEEQAADSWNNRVTSGCQEGGAN
jgi:Lar family restriction alleviation protein